MLDSTQISMVKTQENNGNETSTNQYLVTSLLLPILFRSKSLRDQTQPIQINVSLVCLR